VSFGGLSEEEFGADLPRSQAGGSPQHLLVTLLGDYWLMREEHLPSAALVAMIKEFGVSEVGARAALSRLGRRGVLESSKVGRRTFYGLNRDVARRVVTGASRIMSFGANDTWAGLWTVVTYSLPEGRRDTRHVLRSRLRWMGFAPLYDGVWVSPTADPMVASQALAELGVDTATVLSATNGGLPGIGRAPIDAWDLDELRATYEQFLNRCKQMLVLLQRGDTTTTEALRARTSLMDTYRRFPGLDPELPLELMPRNWPRSAARRQFIEVYDGLVPLAEVRVREIIAAFDPQLAALARCYTSTEILAGTAVPAAQT
jgi:phenylacetic acid degradation operon negative regulatory protein